MGVGALAAAMGAYMRTKRWEVEAVASPNLAPSASKVNPLEKEGPPKMEDPVKMENSLKTEDPKPSGEGRPSGSWLLLAPGF